MMGLTRNAAMTRTTNRRTWPGASTRVPGRAGEGAFPIGIWDRQAARLDQ